MPNELMITCKQSSGIVPDKFSEGFGTVKLLFQNLAKLFKAFVGPFVCK